jgi:CRP-like cAMP-binding protein
MPALAEDAAVAAAALASAGAAPADVSRAWAEAGRRYGVEGRPEDARAAFDEAAMLADTSHALELRSELGILLSDAGSELATDVWLEIYSCAHAEGFGRCAARACFFLFHATGDRAWPERGAAIDAENGWSLRCASVLSTIALDYERSTELLARAIVAARAEEDPVLETFALWGRATVDSFGSEHRRSVPTLRHVVRRLAELGGRRFVVRATADLIELLHESCDAPGMVAQAEWLSTYVRAGGIGAVRRMADAWLASAQCRAGMTREARETLERISTDAAAEGADEYGPFTRVHEATVTAEALGPCDETRDVLDGARSFIREHGLSMIEAELDLVEVRLALAAGASSIELAKLIPAELEPLAAAPCALALARTGTARADRELVQLGARLAATIEREEGEHCPLVATMLEEVRLLAAGNPHALAPLGQRWRAAGFARDAAWCQHLALLGADRGANARALARLHAALVGMGAVLDAAILGSALPRETTGRIVEALAASQMFARLEPRALAELASVSNLVRVAATDIVVHEGDDVVHVYLVASGTVVLQRATGDKVLSVGFVDRGAVFGQLDLECVQAAEVTAIALDECELVSIPVAAVRRLAEVNAQIASSLGAQLLGDLVEHRRRMEQLAYWNVDDRVVDLLGRLADRYGRETLSGGIVIDRPLAQADLARFIGTRRQSVAESFTRLRRTGRVATRRGRIVFYPEPLEA